MNNGFFPALGTPTDESGKVIKESFEKEIEMMIGAGAAGLLCLGSMGKMAFIRNREYPGIAKVCVEIVSGRIPVMVGVMDCSVKRIFDRIEALGKMDFRGVVATPPFYHKISEEETIIFFTKIAEGSDYPVYIYDLPSVTQSPVTEKVMKKLLKVPEIKGIKTANMQLGIYLQSDPGGRNDFEVFYSGLDTFDVAVKSGLKKNLDGMFTCTPYNSQNMYVNMEDGDISAISSHLKDILKLRDLFLKESVFPAYSYAMKLLGCPGNYHPDYCEEISAELKEEIYTCMKDIKEL
mgnify:CR=1 FL=1